MRVRANERKIFEEGEKKTNKQRNKRYGKGKKRFNLEKERGIGGRRKEDIRQMYFERIRRNYPSYTKVQRHEVWFLRAHTYLRIRVYAYVRKYRENKGKKLDNQGTCQRYLNKKEEKREKKRQKKN